MPTYVLICKIILAIFIIGVTLWGAHRHNKEIVKTGGILILLIVCLHILFPITKIAVNNSLQFMETHLEEDNKNTEELNPKNYILP